MTVLVAIAGEPTLDAPACVAALRTHLGLGRSEAAQLVDAIARGAVVPMPVASRDVADALQADLAAAGARAEPA